MSEKFQVEASPSERLVRIKVWGFWSESDAEDYREMLRTAMSSMDPSAPWNILADVRLFPIQPEPVQKVHSQLMKDAMRMGMARSANIVGGILTRIQIEKLSDTAWPERGRFEYFFNETEAMKWLEENADVPEFRLSR